MNPFVCDLFANDIYELRLIFKEIGICKLKRVYACIENVFNEICNEHSAFRN